MSSRIVSGVLVALVGCSASPPSGEPTTTTTTGASTGEPSPSTSVGSLATADSSGTRTTSDSGSEDTGGDVECEEVLFADDFEDLGPPYVEGFPELPLALFDESRWTQLQIDPPDAPQEIRWDQSEGNGVIAMHSVGQPPEVASKIDLGSGTTIRLAPDQTVRIRASLFVESGPQPWVSTTLLDLEDGDDILIDGVPPTPGLRVAVDEDGFIVLDRGEIPGREAPGADPVLRLSTIRSGAPVPLDQWFELDVVIRLGVGVMTSAEPVDVSFDLASTPGWCVMTLRPTDGEPELILRAAGAMAFDREAALEVFAEVAPELEIEWPPTVDFDVFQAGITNNRSTFDEGLRMDDIVVSRVDSLPCGPALDD